MIITVRMFRGEDLADHILNSFEKSLANAKPIMGDQAGNNLADVCSPLLPQSKPRFLGGGSF